MRTRQLECFIRVCELGSITKAARTLNIAQPALGLQIKALEREFGVQLLERTMLGTRPTAAGLTFLKEATYILRRLQELKRTLKEQVESAPQLVMLGITPSMTGILATQLLERVRSAMPRVTLTMMEELSNILIEQVTAGRLDLALIFNAPPSRAFEREPQLRESLYLVTKPGSALDAAAPIPLCELAGIDLTMPSRGDVLRRLLDEELSAAGLPLRVAYPIASMQAMKAVIARGLACGVLPLVAVAAEVEAGILAVRPIVEPALSRTLYLVRPGSVDEDGPIAGVAAVVRAVLAELCAANSSFHYLGR